MKTQYLVFCQTGGVEEPESEAARGAEDYEARVRVPETEV